MIYCVTEKVIIKCWSNRPEDEAIQQLKNLANLPFIFKQVCSMPDIHTGYGMPIGGVIACQDVVIPNAVGSDIGCGMRALQTSLTSIDKETLKKIMSRIREEIPLGKNHHKIGKDTALIPEKLSDDFIVGKEYNSALTQVGTLGGGNHFIEFQKGSDGYIWAMIHSGSRNVGARVAVHYNDIAKKLNAKWHTNVNPKWDLAFLPINEPEGKAYIQEMDWCLRFAKCNRRQMASVIQDAFKEFTAATYVKEIDIHHNYAALESHFGKNVMIHRKGATLASRGTIGIIPGSQGSSSYIVAGLGNPDSFMSCSHGAGRCLGRKDAARTLNLAEEQKKLDDKGIIHSLRAQSDLEEAVSAYKDINVVMEEQKDLVDVLVELTPLAVIKG